MMIQEKTKSDVISHETGKMKISLYIHHDQDHYHPLKLRGEKENICFFLPSFYIILNYLKIISLKEILVPWIALDSMNMCVFPQGHFWASRWHM